MLDAKRIAKLYERFSKKADKYNDFYQQSGVPQYYAEYRRQEELKELCERAMESAEDHDAAVKLLGYMVDLCNRAYDALHYNNLDDYRNVVYRILEINKYDHFVNNRWE